MKKYKETYNGIEYTIKEKSVEGFSGLHYHVQIYKGRSHIYSFMCADRFQVAETIHNFIVSNAK